MRSLGIPLNCTAHEAAVEALCWILGIVLGAQASVVVIHQITGAASHASGPSPFLLMLGGSEVVSALLLLIRRTRRLGACGLLLTLAAAAIFHVAAGQLVGSLAVDAAALLVVLTHDRARQHSQVGATT